MSKLRLRACATSAVAGAIIWAGGAAARAETPVPTAAVADAGAASVQEVIVTARQRAESLQRVPEAVLAYDPAALDKKVVRQINDILAVTPNVAITNGQDPGLALINIRGIDQVRNGEPPVAFIIDGVQLIDSDSFNQNLFDVKSIEILKGPQGAFYGRNAIGGAIVVTTQPPTDEFGGMLKGGYGNGNEVSGQAVLRGPIVRDKLLFSISGAVDHYDGLILSSVLKENGKAKPVDFKDEQNLRARLIFKPTDDLTVDLRAGYEHLSAGASYYIPLPDGNPDNASVPVQNDELGYARRTIRDYSAKVDYRLPFATLTSVTAYSDTGFLIHEDLDWTPVSLFGINQRRGAKGWTEEVRLTSPSDQRLRWMVGGYGLWVDRTVVTDFLLNTNGGPTLNAAFPSADVLQHETDAAAFGQLNYDIRPDLELTLALRYDRETRRQTDHLAKSQVYGSWSKPQPKVSLAYRWTPDVMLYATYGVGFRSGGFNAPSPAYPLKYEPESVNSYEAGFKATFLDRRARLEGALFYNDLKNLQVFAFVGAYQGLFNVEKSHMLGGELQGTFAVTRHLTLDGAYGYIDSKIDQYRLKGAQFESAIPVVPSQIKGNQLPLHFKNTLSVGAEYTQDLPMDGWRATLRGDFSTRSGFYWHIDNYDKEKRRNLLDASLRVSNGDWSVMAYVKNLLDVKYDEEFFAHEWCCAADIRYPSEPRRYGLLLQRNF